MSTKVDMINYYSILRDFFLNFGINLDKYNITYDIFPRKKINLNGVIISE